MHILMVADEGYSFALAINFLQGKVELLLDILNSLHKLGNFSVPGAGPRVSFNPPNKLMR